MGLGVTEEPIYLYLCGGVCVRHVCVRACVYYSSLRPICVVSAEQISQVISEAECYLYLSLSSLSFSPLSYIPIVSHPLSDLIFQLFSSLIPPVLAPSSFPISLSSLNLSAFRQSLSFPSFLTPSISRYFSLFLKSIFASVSHTLKIASTLLDSAYTSSVPPTFTRSTSATFQSGNHLTLKLHTCLWTDDTKQTHTQNDINPSAAHLPKPIPTHKHLLLTQ